MTLARRLVNLEEHLSSTQLVLRWFDEAHAHGSIEAYVRSTLDLTPEEQPLNRLCGEAEETVRATIGGRRGDEFRAALRSALRQVVLHFELVLRANALAPRAARSRRALGLLLILSRVSAA